jgi:hypothetical protein
MRKSEIFESFIKIAQEKGMISNDSNKSKNKLEDAGRADSLSADDIAKLYKTNPKPIKDLEYKHSIMEVAHPNNVVVSPAHDKINGLVENNIERQNVMIRTVLKTPDGFKIQRKYAEKDFILSLVRTANDLDNRNEDQLRALADACLSQVSLKKSGIGPVAGLMLNPYLLGVVAVLGAVYWYEHSSNANEGLVKNYDSLKKELDQLLTSKNEWGFGEEYDATLKQDVVNFEQRLADIMSAYNSIIPIINKLQKPRDASELIKMEKDGSNNEVKAAYNKLSSLIKNLSTFIDQMETNLKSSFYKKEHTKETGWGLDLAKKMNLVGGGYGALIADDFQDVLNALTPFKESIKEVLQVFTDAETIQNKAKADIANAQAKQSSEYGIPENDNAEPLETQQKAASVKELDKMSSSLFANFLK